tara:strand:+ start:980 stop:1240 length:261 start_codon:yes stop_codon:yes gene_type:complete
MNTRDYLANEAINSVDDDTSALASMLLVLYDAGLLASAGMDEDDAPRFALHEDVTDEQLDAAEDAFMALSECDDDAWVGYMSRASH